MLFHSPSGEFHGLPGLPMLVIAVGLAIFLVTILVRNARSWDN